MADHKSFKSPFKPVSNSMLSQHFSDRFPYYKSNDDRWKNSVRHNLSINPHFRKGVKAPQGAGHLWAISSGDSAENVLAWEHVSGYPSGNRIQLTINPIAFAEEAAAGFVLQNGVD